MYNMDTNNLVINPEDSIQISTFHHHNKTNNKYFFQLDNALISNSVTVVHTHLHTLSSYTQSTQYGHILNTNSLQFQTSKFLHGTNNNPLWNVFR